MRRVLVGGLLLGLVGCGGSPDLARLEQDVGKLRAEVRELRAELAAQRASPSRGAAAAAAARGRGEEPTGDDAPATPPAAAAANTEGTESTDEPAAGHGALSLVTEPWSEVYLGDRFVGNTPIAALELLPGSHELRLRNPEAGLEQRVRVRIEAGETTRLHLRLR